MADLTIKKSFTIPSADLKAHHAAALAEVERLAAQAARIAELEAEVARLRAGWASAQTENASLRELVRGAYREGVRGGMREHGLRWQDSTSRKRLDALNYALAAPDTGGAE